MSLSTDVEQLLEVLGPFYEYVKEEEEPGAGPEQNGILGKFSGNINLFCCIILGLKNKDSTGWPTKIRDFRKCNVFYLAMALEFCRCVFLFNQS